MKVQISFPEPCTRSKRSLIEEHGLVCNNEFQLIHMKRFLLASLALMLVISTSGQVFAAVFCPALRDMGVVLPGPPVTPTIHPLIT